MEMKMTFGKTTALLASLLLGASVAMAAGMQGMGAMEGMAKEAGARQMHKASGTVKKLDQKAGTVTLAHGPVATLNWPAMTMSFKVKEKELLPRLAEGSKVDVEFTKQGKDYVIVVVK
jgi:Cu/Ag efflux protein CusF